MRTEPAIGGVNLHDSKRDEDSGEETIDPKAKRAWRKEESEKKKDCEADEKVNSADTVPIITSAGSKDLEQRDLPKKLFRSVNIAFNSLEKSR